MFYRIQNCVGVEKPSPGSSTAGSCLTLANDGAEVKELHPSGPPSRDLEMEDTVVFSGRLPGMGPQASWGKFG